MNRDAVFSCNRAVLEQVVCTDGGPYMIDTELSGQLARPGPIRLRSDRNLLGTLLIGYSVCLWLLPDITSPPTRMTLSCVHCLTVKVTSPLKSAMRMSLSSVKIHPSCEL